MWVKCLRDQWSVVARNSGCHAQSGVRMKWQSTLTVNGSIGSHSDCRSALSVFHFPFYSNPEAQQEIHRQQIEKMPYNPLTKHGSSLGYTLYLDGINLIYKARTGQLTNATETDCKTMAAFLEMFENGYCSTDRTFKPQFQTEYVAETGQYVRYYQENFQNGQRMNLAMAKSAVYAVCPHLNPSSAFSKAGTGGANPYTPPPAPATSISVPAGTTGVNANYKSVDGMNQAYTEPVYGNTSSPIQYAPATAAPTQLAGDYLKSAFEDRHGNKNWYLIGGLVAASGLAIGVGIYYFSK